MIKISKEANPNYIAQIVKLGKPLKHSNADKLQIFVVQGNRVISDMNKKEGDLVIYFPLECQINDIILSKLNLYSSAELNEDKTQKGYFDKKGRVRAVRLRGEPSQGMLLPISILEPILGKLDTKELIENKEFDTWNDILVCKKYIPVANMNSQGGNGNKNKNKNKLGPSRIIDEYFNKHVDTLQLKKNIHMVNPNDIISITYKLHGTSFIVGNIPVKAKLKWYEKIAKFLGVKINDREYDIIYSSRNVIKNARKEAPKKFGYYKTDIYGEVAKVLKDFIPKDYTLYGEVVGYESSGKLIQKDYDYGYEKPTGMIEDTYKEDIHYGIFIYRITFTNHDGKVTELSWDQIKQFCDKYSLKYVPEMYYGSVREYILAEYSSKELDLFREDLLKQLTDEYLEKDCWMCSNKVPGEGVCIRIDKLDSFDVYKLKSFKFLERETKMLDEGEIDIETIESTNQE